jgi:uncharacterized protein (DUF1330 family)
VADEETKVYALNLLDMVDREEYLAYPRRQARKVARYGGVCWPWAASGEHSRRHRSRQVLILVEWESVAVFESYRQARAGRPIQSAAKNS